MRKERFVVSHRMERLQGQRRLYVIRHIFQTRYGTMCYSTLYITSILGVYCIMFQECNYESTFLTIEIC